MSAGGDPAGDIAAGAESPPTAGIEAPFNALVRDREAHRIFVLEADALPHPANPSDFPYPAGSQPAGALDDGELPEPMKLRVATERVDTAADETPASFPIPKRLKRRFQFEREIPLPTRREVRGRVSVGVLEIENADGTMNEVAARLWNGQPARVYLGGTIRSGPLKGRTLAWGEYGVLFEGVVESVETTDVAIQLSLRDPYPLLQGTFQRVLYAGTGGREGPESIEGLPRPVAIGRVQHATPVLVDAAKRIYELHHRAIRGGYAGADTPEGRDKGVILDGGAVEAADYDALDALDASAIQLGGFAWCRAASGSFARLRNDPVGRVTFSYDGDATGSYVEDWKDAIQRVVTLYGEFDATQLQGQSFLRAPVYGPIGFYQGTTPTTLEQALKPMLAGLGYVDFDLRGRLGIGWFKNPLTEPAVDELRFGPAKGMRTESALRPAWRVRIGYARNWSPQGESELAEPDDAENPTNITAEERQTLSQEERSVVIESLSTRGQMPLSEELTISTLLVRKADAEALASNTLSRHRYPHVIARFDAKQKHLTWDPGIVLRLIAQKSAVGTGQFWIRNIAEDFDGAITGVAAWGSVQRG